MKRFCVNCGAEIVDDSMFCASCGAKVDMEPTGKNTYGAQTPINQTKNNTKKITGVVIMLAVVLVIAVVAFNVVGAFTGYKGLLRKTMKAIEDYDIETLVSESSDIYFDLDNDEYLESKYERQVGNIIDTFEDKIGNNYKFKYTVNDMYVVSDRKFDKVMQSIENISILLDVDVIDEVAMAEVTMTASSSKRSKDLDITVYMSKENGSWKLLYLESED